MYWLYVLDAVEAFLLAPPQERARRLPVGRLGVPVVNVDGEEFQEAHSPALTTIAGSFISAEP